MCKKNPKRVKITVAEIPSRHTYLSLLTGSWWKLPERTPVLIGKGATYFLISWSIMVITTEMLMYRASLARNFAREDHREN